MMEWMQAKETHFNVSNFMIVVTVLIAKHVELSLEIMH
jgi:hypothetical protein